MESSSVDSAGVSGSRNHVAFELSDGTGHLTTSRLRLRSCASTWSPARGRTGSPDISTMIADHRKITASTANPNSPVEPFRQADWIDVTGGLRRFRLVRADAKFL